MKPIYAQLAIVVSYIAFLGGLLYMMKKFYERLAPAKA